MPDQLKSSVHALCLISLFLVLPRLALAQTAGETPEILGPEETGSTTETASPEDPVTPAAPAPAVEPDPAPAPPPVTEPTTTDEEATPAPAGDPGPAPEAAPDPYPVFGVPATMPDDKVIIWHSDDETQWITFGGYMQPRFEYTNDDSNIQKATKVDKFVLNKTRITFKMRLATWASAKIEFDLYDPHTSSPVLPVDVYGSFPLWPYLELRGGFMKVPVVYQHMMPGRNKLFAEDAMVTSQKVTRKAGMGASFNMSAFPSSDVGFMVMGDLFPWPHWDRMRDWPKGILRYYLSYTNGYDLFKGQSKNDASMIAFRVEVNPFGYRSYDESNPDFEPYVMASFNYGKSIDLNSNYDIAKDAYLMGVDGIVAWQGVSIAGAWYRYTSAGSKEYERQTVFDPAFQTEGWYVQVAGFIPGWKLREHLELKFRYQRFDPFEQVVGHLYTDAQDVEFRPRELTRPQDRMTDIITIGANVYFHFPGFPNRVKLSFDYDIRTEVEDMWIDDAWNDTQIRNNTWMLQLQFAI